MTERNEQANAEEGQGRTNDRFRGPAVGTRPNRCPYGSSDCVDGLIRAVDEAAKPACDRIG